MNIYARSFSSSQIAEAAGITHAHFRSLVSRKQWGVIGNKAELNGKAHLFSIYDAVGYALAARLMAFGVSPAVAFERAMHDFAHAGGEEFQPDGSIIEREPGGLYSAEHGATFYVMVEGADRGQCVSSQAIGDPLLLLFSPSRSFGPAALIVHLNELRDRVFHALGLDARDYE